MASSASERRASTTASTASRSAATRSRRVRSVEMVVSHPVTELTTSRSGTADSGVKAEPAFQVDAAGRVVRVDGMSDLLSQLGDERSGVGVDGEVVRVDERRAEHCHDRGRKCQRDGQRLGVARRVEPTVVQEQI